MNKTRASVPGLLALLLVACTPGAQGPSTTSAPTGPAVAATPSPTPAATRAATFVPPPTAVASPDVCQPGPDQAWVSVDAQANLFGAVLDRPPAPGGGGAGVLPPVIELPAGNTRLVTVACTGGKTDFAAGTPSLGAEGFVGTQTTDVESYGGISGLLMEGQVMFLAGVFTTDVAPAKPAPERLDFTGKADFERLEPEIGQTFFIGDGAGKTFVAPSGATRLYLGFVDALFFVGQPGWYGNNRGALEATVAITVK